MSMYVDQRTYDATEHFHNAVHIVFSKKLEKFEERVSALEERDAKRQKTARPQGVVVLKKKPRHSKNKCCHSNIKESQTPKSGPEDPAVASILHMWGAAMSLVGPAVSWVGPAVSAVISDAEKNVQNTVENVQNTIGSVFLFTAAGQ